MTKLKVRSLPKTFEDFCDEYPLTYKESLKEYLKYLRMNSHQFYYGKFSSYQEWYEDQMKA